MVPGVRTATTARRYGSSATAMSTLRFADGAVVRTRPDDGSIDDTIDRQARRAAARAHDRGRVRRGGRGSGPDPAPPVRALGRRARTGRCVVAGTCAPARSRMRSPGGMEIRRLTPADAPAYRTLMLDAYAAHPDAFLSGAAERATMPGTSWAERLDSGSDATCVVFGVVGAALSDRAKTRHKASIVGLFVRTAAQHRLGPRADGGDTRGAPTSWNGAGGSAHRDRGQRGRPRSVSLAGLRRVRPRAEGDAARWRLDGEAAPVVGPQRSAGTGGRTPAR